MFDQVLKEVKEHLDQDPAVAGQIPAEHREEVHQEVAKGVTDGLKNQAAGGLGGMVSTGGGGGGSMVSSVTSAVSERLTGKFGLSQSAVQSISAAVPKIVQKFMK